MKVLLTILWGLGCPFVFIWFCVKWVTTKSKARKYIKSPEDFLESEKYEILYKLAKPVNYLLRIKLKDILKDSHISKRNQLVIANHRSYVDLLVLYSFLYEQLETGFVFVAKQELADSKIGHILKLVDTIFIDRNNLRQMVSSIETQKKLISEKNKSVVIFPEGTRNTENQLLEFKSGAFEVAYKTMCLIQPIIFWNTEDYWENRKESKKNKRPIYMEVLPVYQPDKFLHIDRQIFTKNIQKQMQKVIDDLIKKQKQNS